MKKKRNFFKIGDVDKGKGIPVKARERGGGDTYRTKRNGSQSVGDNELV